MSQLPFSQACENNKGPILDVLRGAFADVDYVLEIGSGTGQHAVHFAEQLPHLCWQCSDQAEYLPGVRSWLQWAQLANTPEPLTLDVMQPWPVSRTPAIFSANTLHIMSWEAVQAFFSGMGAVLTESATVCIYGPFNYDGRYTSDSNANFDQWLKQRDPASGIRDFAAVNQLAAAIGLQLLEDVAMPANNRCLVWRRQGAD